MTNEETGYSPQASAGQGKRRLNIWILLLVVDLPLLSVALRLPLWSTLLLLLAGVAFLALFHRLKTERQPSPKQTWMRLLATYVRLESAHVALQESPSDADAQKRLSKLLAECLSLLGSRADSDWGADSGYVTKVREDVIKMWMSDQDKERHIEGATETQHHPPPTV